MAVHTLLPVLSNLTSHINYFIVLTRMYMDIKDNYAYKMWIKKLIYSYYIKEEISITNNNLLIRKYTGLLVNRNSVCKHVSSKAWRLGIDR